ncbi:diguanylate cyclase [Mesorhizobium sp. SB112]|uniref:GGDEF domain-containing protein n=1 Tax=Mesorhizobium sp. SB112 TaxID=3151853 RepID=UPI00326517FD
MDETDILLGLVRSLGYSALLALGFAWIFEHLPRGVAKEGAIGALFAIAGLVSMSDPITIASGRITDARTIVVVLAATYGGPTGAMVSGVVLIAYRLMIGGEGATFGAIGIALTGVGALMIARLPHRLFRQKWLRFAMLGTAGSVGPILLFLLNNDFSNLISAEILFSILTANVIGVIVLGYFLDRERNRVRLKRALEDAASRDPLTKLANRRAFEDRALPVFATGSPKTKPAALIMIDVDYFKHVNDRWGHHIGDEVLKKVAETVSRLVRSTDFVARFGGEEMVILLPSTSIAAATATAERIRERVSRLDFSHVDAELAVTLSAGVAGTDLNFEDFQSVLKAADSALYKAKAGGRNQVQSAEAAV